MPVRSNPFYTYQDKAIGQGFDGLAALMVGSQQAAAAPKAPAPNTVALADKYRAETAGIISKNDALNTPPAMLAELFMSGGKVADDPFERNPSYTPMSDQPMDFSLTAEPASAEYQPYFKPGRSANEKVGLAIQEALVRGIKADEIAKLFAQGGYLANVNAGTPEAGMPYMPLFGSAPTTSTALTVGQQNAMSARDAAEALAQAKTTAGIQAASAANVANINQAGQDRRFANRPLAAGRTGAPGGVKPGTVPTVTPTTIKGMTNVVNDRLKGLGFSGVDPRVVDGLVTAASQRFQDPAQAGNFKNPAAAVDSVLNDLNAGTLPGFESATQPGGWFSRDKKTLSRTAPAPAPAPATPAPAAMPLKPAPAETMSRARAAIKDGADKNAVIERLRQAGFDPKGL